MQQILPDGPMGQGTPNRPRRHVKPVVVPPNRRTFTNVMTHEGDSKIQELRQTDPVTLQRQNSQQNQKSQMTSYKLQIWQL